MSDRIVRGYAELITRNAARGILLDTNLLLLYSIGLGDRASIRTHRRTRQYSTDDFDDLQKFIRPFHRIVTTPHILAETSNLAIAGRAKQPRSHVYTLIKTIRATKELHIEKDALLDAPHMSELGLTDTGIIEIAKRNQLLVLTDDLTLASYLAANRCEVVNLNHIRTPRLLK